MSLGKKRNAKTVKICSRILFALALIVPVYISKNSTAGLRNNDLRAHVEIDGVNYGTFDSIDGLLDLDSGIGMNETYKRISFKRDFVTDPSLYLWAKNTMQDRSDLKDVHVVMENNEGEEVSRYVLKYCQPLSWTVEAANPALGGFHEKIDIAVQEITLF